MIVDISGLVVVFDELCDVLLSLPGIAEVIDHVDGVRRCKRWCVRSDDLSVVDLDVCVLDRNLLRFCAHMGKLSKVHIYQFSDNSTDSLNENRNTWESYIGIHSHI